MARHIYQKTVTYNDTGTSVQGATVTVSLTGTSTLATIYATSSGGTPISGSVVTTDSTGFYKFYVDDTDYVSTQKFRLTIVIPNKTDPIVRDDVEINPQAPSMTTKGDILTNDGTNDIRVAVGTDGQILVSDSASTGGLKWKWHTKFSGALVQNSTAKTLATGSFTTLNFDTEVYDTDGFHSLVTNTDRFTVQANLGSVVYVRLYASAVFNVNATGSRVLTFLKNGTNVAGLRGLNVGAAGTGTTDLSIVTPPIPATAGDYFQVQGYQDSGGNLDIVAGWTFSFGLEILR